MGSRIKSFVTIISYNVQYNKNTIRTSRSWAYLFVVGLVSLNYIILGALVFSKSESVKEESLESRLEEERRLLLADNPCVSQEVLEDFIQLIVNSRSMGVRATHNATNPRDWSFASACFFTTGLLSSIGYGNAVPLTRTGRTFCVLYLLIGTPLMLGFISATVSKLTALSNDLSTSLQKKSECRPKTFRTIYNSLVGCVFVAVFILLPAVAFAVIEPSWGFFESVYYCFISLSTIGLGDFVPGDDIGQKYRSTYKIATAIYLQIGVIFYMFIMAIFKDETEFESQVEEIESEKTKISKSLD